MKLFGKLALWIGLLILLGIFSWGLTLLMAWPFWIGAAFFLSIVALYFFIKFMRRVVLVMRSRNKLAQQSASSRSHIAQQATPAAILKAKWKTAITLLRNSNLKRLGNPLHVLPWYLLIGKSGAGKTTALTRARLLLPLQKNDQNSRIEPTADVDWWYFNEAVVIDCAGRYVDAGNSEPDRREWELGMDLLARYRPKHGIDGLVLAISVDRLCHPDKDALLAEASVVRHRIEQLIRMFGKRFPIYVLVTKCDQLYGMETWAQQLPEAALQQAMGYLSDDKEEDCERYDGRSFLDAAFESIGAHLQVLRLTLIADSPAVAPGLLLFPNELAAQKAGLQIFLQACMGDNPYLETPLLRGLFFSSGLQQGGAVSTLIDKDRVLPETVHMDTHTGLFLHDFFGHILPRDRHSWRPAVLVNHWRTVTQNFGLVSWLLFCGAIGIIVTLSFSANMMTLSLMKTAWPFDAVFSGKLMQDVVALERFNTVLRAVEERNNDWKTKWMIKSAAIHRLERKLEQNYVENFRKYIRPVRLKNSQADFDNAKVADTSALQISGLVRNLVREINLLKARQNGANYETLRAMPQREYRARYTHQVFGQLNELMLSHLAWSPAKDVYFAERIALLQMQLNNLVAIDPQMRWLAGLISNKHSIGDIKAADFWNGSGVIDDGIAPVPAAFTRAGKAAIDSFLDEMRNSVSDSPQFLLRRAAFESWYRQQRMMVWHKFLTDFPDAERKLIGEEAWRAALGEIAGAGSPYYRLLARLNTEFDDEPEQDLPGWLQLARIFGRLNAQGKGVGMPQKTVKIVDAINAVGGKVVRKTLQGAPQAGQKMFTDDLTETDLLRAYLADIKNVAVETIGGQGKAYEIAANFHVFGSTATKPSPIHAALDALSQLKQLLGHDDAMDSAVWRLIEGPLHFVLTYTEQQASCELQKEWQAKVQWPLQAAPTNAAMREQLYGEKSSILAFADGMAKPFLERDAKRFNIVQTLGYSVPFTNAFLPMLNNAVDKRRMQLEKQQNRAAEQQASILQAQQDQLQAQQTLAQIERDLGEIKQQREAVKLQTAQLTITAQPSSINPEALLKPFATVLTVGCATMPYQLRNFNFPSSASLAWTPGQCRDTVLQIKIGTLVLAKHYAGVEGLVDFVRDFATGTREFNVAEFPAFKDKLDALKITKIGVHYGFEGQDVVLRIAQQLESLDRREKQALLERQRIQDRQSALAGQSLQNKIVQQVLSEVPYGSHGASAEEQLPQQIGVCWGSDSMASPNRTF